MSTVEAIGNNGANETVQAPRAGRARKARGTAQAKKTLKLSLSPETIALLQLHAMQAQKSLSQYSTEMIHKHCVAWVAHRRPGPKPEA